MDDVILEYSYTPGFMGNDFVLRDLWVSRTFEYKLRFSWYLDVDDYPDNEEEVRLQRRFTIVKDKLPEELRESLTKVMQSDVNVIVPVKVKTDKIEYATSAHPENKFYDVEIQNERKHINIPYDISKTLIEGTGREMFLGFHIALKAWIDEEFELASEGKAIKFNKRNQ